MGTTRLAPIPGKLFLAGEYAVLGPGQPAVVLAIDRTLHVVVARADTSHVEIPVWHIDARDLDPAPDSGDSPRPTDPREAFVRRLWHETQHRAGGGTAHVVVEPHDRDLLARDLGLGTSAALAVAFARALLDAPADSPAVLDLALAAHAAAQGGRSSGADVATAWAGRSIVLRTASDAGTLPIIAPFVPVYSVPLQVWHSGHSQRTGEAVTSFSQLQHDRPADLAPVLDQLGAAAAATIAAATTTLPDLITAVTRAADGLTRLATLLDRDPPIPPDLATAAAATNAIVKTSGALGGDCLFAIAPTPDALTTLAPAVAAAGFEPLDLQPIIA